MRPKAPHRERIIGYPALFPTESEMVKLRVRVTYILTSGSVLDVEDAARIPAARWLPGDGGPVFANVHDLKGWRARSCGNKHTQVTTVSRSVGHRQPEAVCFHSKQLRADSEKLREVQSICAHQQ